MTLIQITTKMNLNPVICSKCGGDCCKYQPGITAPTQWGATREAMTANLAEAFRTGWWAVDWWEGDAVPDGDLDDVYFVRPHAVGFDKDTLFHGAGHDRQCNFLTAAGCSLKPEERPDGCLHLIPEPSHENCLPKGAPSKREYAVMWRPFQDVILAAATAVGASKDDRETDDVQPWWSSSSW
jgi:hypothetical protein